MTTEQMDEKDGLTYRGRDVALPVTLWGEPALEDLKTAIDQAGDRGVLILPSQGIEAEEFWVDIGRNGEPVTTDQRICADPACPFPGRHVRKDEGATDRCPLDTRVSVADLADPYSEDAEPTQHMDWGVTENTEAAMAEEPIEARLRRAWLNGFREGSERTAWGERWDRH